MTQTMTKTRKRLAAGAVTVVAVAAIAVAGTFTVRSYRATGDTSNDASVVAFQPDANSAQYGTDATISKLQQKIEKNDQDFASMLGLANAYLQKVRETGDPALYAKAEAILDRAAKVDAESPDLFAGQAYLALARHDFTGALELGQKAVAVAPDVARYHGIVGDALIELGQYPEAINSLQRMAIIRPDFAAYSRAAYARELYGDTEGAIEAWQGALEAGAPFPENVAWANVQLGNLQITFNHLDDASRSYSAALERVTDYPPALAGQARIATINGDYDEAKRLYAMAFERMPLAEYAVALGDIATRQGDTKEADRQYGLVRAIDTLQSQNGVNLDLEVALFMADRGTDPAGAIERARQAWTNRPNIHSADALAWALYQDGQYEEAQQYATEALKLGTRDSLKEFHAAMIAKALGQTEDARDHLNEAL
ncbi:hypothetical protein AYO38_11145, partial [bacterium SCGC AG-212-C10]